MHNPAIKPTRHKPFRFAIIYPFHARKFAFITVMNGDERSSIYDNVPILPSLQGIASNGGSALP
jgi:hypothetical protein